MKHAFIVFTFICIFCSCTVADIKTEEEALAYLNKVENGNEVLDKTFITKCIEYSWWKAGEKTIDLAYKNDIDISKIFARAVSKQRSSIQKLQNIINKNREDYSIISPTFQWAQGQTDLKMNIKLAHKWDTPATLGCSVEKVTFQQQGLYFEAKCPSTKKKFVLNLLFTKKINPDACDWSEAAVGRIVINMKKFEAGLWNNIIIKTKSTPKNIHPWWSMQDQLDKADQEKEDAEQRKLDEQRAAAEKQYWEMKKKREEEEKAAQEASEASEANEANEATKVSEEKADKTTEKVAETTEKVAEQESTPKEEKSEEEL